MATKTKATTDSNGQPLQLQITEHKEHGYYHVYGRVVIMKQESTGPMPYGPDDDYSDGLLWTGLQVRCQGDERSRQRNAGHDAPVYGFEVSYHDAFGSTIGLRRCRRMCKTLEKIERGLEQLQAARGYARSYGEYLGRVAEVLGCAGMCFAKSAAGRNVTGEHFTWTSIGDGVNRTNQAIFIWQQDGQPAAGVEVAS